MRFPSLKKRRDKQQSETPVVSMNGKADEDASKFYPGRAARVWIRFVNKHVVWMHLAASLFVWALLNLVFLLFYVGGATPEWMDVLREIFIVLAALSIPWLGTIVALARPLRPVIEILGASGVGAAVILAFFGDTVRGMNVTLVELRNGGAVLEPWEVAGWVRRCFRAATGQYVGTDSHLPSLYERLYSDYLSAHEEYLLKTGREDSVRIVLVEVEQLRTDRYKNPNAFNKFMQWHTGRRAGTPRRPVALLRLSSYDDQKLVEAKDDWNPKLVNVDIGFWRGNFALLFTRSETADEAERVRVSLAVAGEQLYADCEDYVDELLKATDYEGDTPRDLTEELPIYSDELSDHWRQFCEPAARLKKTGPFLESILERFGSSPKDIRVFDAAAGIGIEAAYLLKRGYFVVANEIEPALRIAAQQYAVEVETQIPDALFTRLDWLTMSEKMMPDGFHTVYVLGNSLCHLESLDQVDEAIKNFYDVLVPGGVLICDERNFSYIEANWSKLDRDHWNTFRFNQRDDKVMYHGTQVMGAPVRRRANRIVFEYAEIKKEKGKIVPGKIVGDLSMLAFGKGELKERLELAGFRDVAVYGDLERSDGNRLDDKADFFTYVATKPGGGA